MNTTHFDVYANLPQRGWQLHARFTSQEREQALAEAHEVETMGYKAKVTREVFNSTENTYEESDVYISRNMDRAPPSLGARPSGGTAARVAGATPPPLAKLGPGKTAKAPPKAVITSRAFSLIVLVVLLGVLAGLAAVRVLPDLINLAWKLGYRVDLNMDSYDSLLVTTFATAFLLISAPLFLMLMPKMFGTKKKKRSTASSADFQQHQEVRRQQMQQSLEDLSRQALMEEQVRADLDEHIAAAQAAMETDTAPPSADAAPQAPQAPQDELPPAAQPLPMDEESASPAAAQAATLLRTFVDSAINAIHNTKIHLDSYNKFALHLYIAGAVDVLGDHRNLLAYDRRHLTGQALTNLGTKREMAMQFYDKVPEYTIEERYQRMVQNGRAAMADYLKGDEGGAHSHLTAAIQEWSRGNTGGANAPTVTVMFTDMVGSTDMTQDRGDAGAQEIVRRHNTIVRMAISQYGGKEIKHTGDGIMASFDDCTGAVDAAIAIQRNVGNHNTARPDQPLSLRIGLNTGKPIQEENDIFGATVQLAARVCAATQPDQILCTDSVLNRSRGRSELMTPIGPQVLKGFKDPVPLHKVRW